MNNEIGVSETAAELGPGRDADYFTAVARIKHQNGRRMMGRRRHCLREAEPVECREYVGAELDAVTDGAELWCLLQYAHGMPALTEHTITDRAQFARELALIRERGYAIDEGEQELGVRCVAVALPSNSTRAATSISGPLTRMTDTLIRSAVPLLTDTASALAEELDLVDTSERSA